MKFWQSIKFGKIDSGFYVTLGDKWLLLADEWRPSLEKWRKQNKAIMPAYIKYKKAMAKLLEAKNE